MLLIFACVKTVNDLVEVIMIQIKSLSAINVIKNYQGRLPPTKIAKVLIHMASQYNTVLATGVMHKVSVQPDMMKMEKSVFLELAIQQRARTQKTRSYPVDVILDRMSGAN